MPSLLNLLSRNAHKGSLRAEGNTIELYDVIVGSDIEAEWWGGISPTGFRRALEAMAGPVTVRINSPGGDVFAGRAIAQAIREYKADVTVQVDGYAASIASIIAIAGTRCIMAPGSMMMIHKSWTFAIGNSEDMLETADLLEKVDGTIAETYAAKGNKSVDEFAALMAAETWFTASEAVAVGLADEAISDGPKASARWDLSAYAKAPLADAEPAPAPTANDNAHRIRAHAARMALKSA